MPVQGFPSGYVHFKVTLGRDTKSICDSIEKGKHGRDVYSFGDLGFSPAVVA